MKDPPVVERDWSISPTSYYRSGMRALEIGEQKGREGLVESGAVRREDVTFIFAFSYEHRLWGCEYSRWGTKNLSNSNNPLNFFVPSLMAMWQRSRPNKCIDAKCKMEWRLEPSTCTSAHCPLPSAAETTWLLSLDSWVTAVISTHAACRKNLWNLHI